MSRADTTAAVSTMAGTVGIGDGGSGSRGHRTRRCRHRLARSWVRWRHRAVVRGRRARLLLLLLVRAVHLLLLPLLLSVVMAVVCGPTMLVCARMLLLLRLQLSLIWRHVRRVWLCLSLSLVGVVATCRSIWVLSTTSYPHSSIVCLPTKVPSMARLCLSWEG